ncbi:MAG: arabinofuranan 3-O-arabinosyltransferase, partial [Mycobacterium sp.]|nr:arabinofuranan 3-O-arabinosyltransferase [Mycobacterium sp.]
MRADAGPGEEPGNHAQLATMRTGQRPGEESGPDEVTPLRRRWIWLVAVIALGLSFGSSPGRISPDTKLDLTANPLRFLSRATSLWNSELP